MNVSTSRVVAVFGAQEIFSLDFTSKNGRVYFACSCDLRAQELFSLDFTSKNGRFYFPCSCDPARVLIFDHKSLFSLEFSSNNGRFYFACSCDLRAQVSVFIGFLPEKIDISTSRVVAIFGHKSCFH